MSEYTVSKAIVTGAAQGIGAAIAQRLSSEGLTVSVLDVNDLVCPDGYCAPVLGGVVTFFDHGHLSATFAATLEPEVTAAMEQRIAG